jgi:hypothetical protein
MSDTINSISGDAHSQVWRTWSIGKVISWSDMKVCFYVPPLVLRAPFDPAPYVEIAGDDDDIKPDHEVAAAG